MPQASLEVSQNWKGGSKAAYQLLELNFSESRGYFYPKVTGYEPTDQEGWAIRYMIEEWDYGYCAVKPTFPDQDPGVASDLDTPLRECSVNPNKRKGSKT